MYTLGAGEILIKSIIIVCLLNLIAWKASCAHKTGENEKKNIKIKKVGPNVERLCSYLYEDLPVQTKWQFCPGDLYFWLFCCMNNFCISHRLIHITTHSFCELSSMLISHCLVTSWFDSVCVTVACWVNFKENNLHEYELQFSDYNV